MGSDGLRWVLVHSEVLWVLVGSGVQMASGGFRLRWALVGFGGLNDSGEF